MLSHEPDYVFYYKKQMNSINRGLSASEIYFFDLLQRNLFKNVKKYFLFHALNYACNKNKLFKTLDY